MRVTTPIADLDITIQSLRVQAGALVMEGAPEDAMPTRAALLPSDVRRLLFLMLRPEVIGFALKSLFAARSQHLVRRHTPPTITRPLTLGR